MVKVVGDYNLLNTAKPFVFLALVGGTTSHEPSEIIGHNLQGVHRPDDPGKRSFPFSFVEASDCKGVRGIL